MSLLHTAQRQKAKLRIGLSGPSGSGKTYSALLLASGLAPWNKIALIDTENGSGELYAHLGAYNVVTLTAPFAPERYIELIRACETAGMEVILVDSSTHEWEGKGGCLESNELLGQTKFRGNSWAAWSVTTPRHQKFLEAITTSPCHIITTVRSKIDTIQTEDKKIKKVGIKDIQREGFEYELTLSFALDRDKHYAMASKDRTGIFSELDPFIISAETGKTLLAWANSGSEPVPVSAAKQTSDFLTRSVNIPITITKSADTATEILAPVAKQIRSTQNTILKSRIKELCLTLDPALKTGNDFTVLVLAKTGFDLADSSKYSMIIKSLGRLIPPITPPPVEEIKNADQF